MRSRWSWPRTLTVKTPVVAHPRPRPAAVVGAEEHERRVRATPRRRTGRRTRPGSPVGPKPVTTVTPWRSGPSACRIRSGVGLAGHVTGAPPAARAPATRRRPGRGPRAARPHGPTPAPSAFWIAMTATVSPSSRSRVHPRLAAAELDADDLGPRRACGSATRLRTTRPDAARHRDDGGVAPRDAGRRRRRGRRTSAGRRRPRRAAGLGRACSDGDDAEDDERRPRDAERHGATTAGPEGRERVWPVGPGRSARTSASRPRTSRHKPAGGDVGDEDRPRARGRRARP